MTAVRFWDVGAVGEASLPMTASHMAAHLAADWLPGLSPLGGAPLVSWPFRLMLPYHDKKSSRTLLRVRRRVAWSDRQWNGVLSWMVGVCGARQYLVRDGYLWVAPLSAFYADKRKHVDIDPKWPTPLRPGKLTATSAPTNPSRLMPDYVALRKGVGADDWHLALVEAKGTAAALQNRTACPKDWHDQARNAIVRFEGTRIVPDRHLVTATRCNPDKARKITTALQLRAWNHEEATAATPTGAAMEVATVALLGICNNLGLRANARCLLDGHELRAMTDVERLASTDRLEAHKVLDRAAVLELQHRCDCHRTDEPTGWTAAYVRIPGLEHRHHAKLLPTTIALLRLLSHPMLDEGLEARFTKYSKALQAELTAMKAEQEGAAVVPPGLVLVVEEDAE